MAHFRHSSPSSVGITLLGLMVKWHFVVGAFNREKPFTSETGSKVNRNSGDHRPTIASEGAVTVT